MTVLHGATISVLVGIVGDGEHLSVGEIHGDGIRFGVLIMQILRGDGDMISIDHGIGIIIMDIIRTQVSVPNKNHIGIIDQTGTIHKNLIQPHATHRRSNTQQIETVDHTALLREHREIQLHHPDQVIIGMIPIHTLPQPETQGIHHLEVILKEITIPVHTGTVQVLALIAEVVDLYKEQIQEVEDNLINIYCI